MDLIRKYPCHLIKVIDGDSFIADIDLGFDIVLKSQSVRLDGIDTPELHSSDPVEQKQALLSKQALIDLISSSNLILQVSKNDRDKYGRILAIMISNGVNVNEHLSLHNYAVKYEGENKSKVKKQHLLNRQILINKGLLTI